jgi:cytosine/adenosine deaminase-related metal-dependent hydrolase
LGFAFDGFRFQTKETLQALMKKLEENKVQLITYHYSRVPEQGTTSQTVELQGLGILDDRFLVSHGGNPSQEDADIYKQFGMHVSSTPSTELQMAMGSPVAAFRDDLGDEMPRCCSLGIDCHSNNSAFIPGEARIGLQSARASRGEVSDGNTNLLLGAYTSLLTSGPKQKFLAQGKSPLSVHYTAEEAFNLSTIRGARAAKMADKVGSIAEGKQADLVIFSGTSPGMIAAAQHDPVAAVILHSSPGDIEHVVIDGVLRKRAGKLIDVDVEEQSQEFVGQQKLAWADVAKEVIARREVLQKKIEKINMADVTEALIDQWHLDRSKLVDCL